MPTSGDSRPGDRAEGRDHALLAVHGLSAGYGGHAVVRDIDLAVPEGRMVCILGPNGAGKSTVLKAIVGGGTLLRGRIELRGKDVTGLGADALARRGVGYVPQVRECFDTLTVRENLEMGGYLFRKSEVRERVSNVLELFPALRKMLGRRVRKLSGGERKMVAIGRVLMIRPDLLIMDEPTSGLSPRLSSRVLRECTAKLASEGVGVLLVEQRARAALEVADFAYVIAEGGIRVHDQAQNLLERPDLGSLLLGKETLGRAAMGSRAE